MSDVAFTSLCIKDLTTRLFTEYVHALWCLNTHPILVTNANNLHGEVWWSVNQSFGKTPSVADVLLIFTPDSYRFEI